MPDATATATTTKVESKMVKCYVPLTLGDNTTQINYAYTTRRKNFTTLKTECGIVEVVANTQNLFWGVNSPKPYRVTLINDDGTTVSSWAENGLAKALMADEKYIVTPGTDSNMSISASKNVISVYVELKANASGKVKYGWNMSRATFNDTKLAVDKNLGIKAITANDLSTIIRGVNKPHPPRASKQVGKRTIETFFSPTTAIIGKLEEAGWRAIGLKPWETIAST